MLTISGSYLCKYKVEDFGEDVSKKVGTCRQRSDCCNVSMRNSKQIYLMQYIIDRIDKELDMDW